MKGVLLSLGSILLALALPARAMAPREAPTLLRAPKPLPPPVEIHMLPTHTGKPPEIRWTRDGHPLAYTLTEKDVLVLTRAVAHEGKPYSAVVWALLQRFMTTYKTSYANLATMVEAYAQPINPDWFTTGRRHLAYLEDIQARPAGPERDAAMADELRRASLREGYARAPWESIDEKYKDAVVNVLNGSTPCPAPHAEHYRASSATDGSTEEQAKAQAQAWADRNRPRQGWLVADVGAGFKKGVNWFYTTPASRKNHLQAIGLTGELPKA